MRCGRSICILLASLLVSVARADAPLSVRTASDGGFDRAVERALPRVVKLYGLGAGLEQGYGSGIVISQDGLILTVLSLLIDARAIRAVAADGTLYQASVVYRDDERQTAVLQLSLPSGGKPEGASVSDAEAIRPSNLPYFELNCADARSATNPCSATLTPGDWVIAAGNAFKVADGVEPVSIAHGVFSTRTRLDARRRMRDFPYNGDVLVIDGIVSNPGAPGGAIVNLDGQLVGMIGREVLSNLTHTHLNYGIPVDVLRETIDASRRPTPTDAADVASLPRSAGDPADSAVAAKASPRVDIGIRLSRTGYQSVLPYVERVVRESPASKVGVRKDDLILAIGSHNVSSAEEFESRLRSLRAGEDVVLVVRRGREILSFHVPTTVEERNP